MAQKISRTFNKEGASTDKTSLVGVYSGFDCDGWASEIGEFAAVTFDVGVASAVASGADRTLCTSSLRQRLSFFNTFQTQSTSCSSQIPGV